MKILKNTIAFLFILLTAFACTTDEDKLYSLDYITAPANVNAIFDITQDNTGLVSIIPNAEGAQKYLIAFGDGAGEPKEYNLMATATHTYTEGVYQVGITAIGATGLETKIIKELNVTFKAPQNLKVTITKNTLNPKIVTVTAIAEFATIIDVYFGDVQDEIATHLLPAEVATHTYVNPGNYQVKIVAKSAGKATTEYTETVKISAASDPVKLPVGFESFLINYAFTDFGNVVSSVVDNPDATGMNTTAKVGKTVKTAGAETWGGSFLTLGNPIDFSTNKSFKVKVWSPKVGSIVKLKVENLTDGNINKEVDATTTVADKWEELTFDFSTIDMTREYQKVVIFFDFGNVGDGAAYFFDDIKLAAAVVPSSLMVENFEGAAPAFTVFGNIANIELVANPDASGANKTSKVAKLAKTAGAETWAGAFFEAGKVLDFSSFSNIKLKTWSPKSGIVVKVKLENANSSIVHEVDMNTTTANAWEELTYDFSGAPAADYMRVVIFFDFGNPGDDSVYYYDEFELTN